jgi:hypothetical protein
MFEKPKRPLHVQEYRIDPTEIWIADCRNEVPPVVGYAFDIAERCGPGPISVGESFAFSQAVALLVRRAGFDAILVPGVRSKNGLTYANVVVFAPGQRWRRWSLGPQGFNRVSD